jgi:exosortase
MAAHAHVLRALVEFARENPTASHTVAVPFITLALILDDRKAVLASVRSASLAGAAVILVGLTPLLAVLLLGAPRPESSLSLSVSGLVVSWIGLFVSFYGVDAARVALFPLAFLAFMIPIPLLVIDWATSMLKVASTETVAGLFTLTGTPYYREGFVFSLPTFVIEVADRCSGIRSSIALGLTCLVAGHLSLRSWWSKVLLVLAAIPIAVFKNGVRIVTLSQLAIHWDPSFLVGRLHHEGGFVFFGLGLAMLTPVLAGLRRMEKTREEFVMIDQRRQGPDLNTTWSRRLTRISGARTTREN